MNSGSGISRRSLSKVLHSRLRVVTGVHHSVTRSMKGKGPESKRRHFTPTMKDDTDRESDDTLASLSGNLS